MKHNKFQKIYTSRVHYKCFLCYLLLFNFVFIIRKRKVYYLKRISCLSRFYTHRKLYIKVQKVNLFCNLFRFFLNINNWHTFCFNYNKLIVKYSNYIQYYIHHKVVNVILNFYVYKLGKSYERHSYCLVPQTLLANGLSATIKKGSTQSE